MPLSFLLAALALPVPVITCAPLAGAEALIADRSYQWLLVGEQHGTSEIPAAFSNLVCLFAQQRRPIVIGLEYPASEQSRIDDFLESDGGAAAQHALVDASIWRNAMQDGRTSRAFLALLEQLRQLRKQLRIEGVVAFQPEWRGAPAAYEEDMASLLRNAAARAPDTVLLVLVGNAHAVKTTQQRGKELFRPMGNLLPGEATVTLNVVSNGGGQWGCFFQGKPAPGASPVCGTRDFGPAPTAYPAGITLTRQDGAPYSGNFYLGARTTASPPAVPLVKAVGQ